MQSLETQIAHWQTQSIELLPPEHPDDVRRVFANLGSQATADVLHLYSRIGGMPFFDNALWQLWSLPEIQEGNSPATDYGAGESGIVFADFFTRAWCYKLRPIDTDVSAVFVDFYDGNKPTLISPSLAAFFDAYVCDADELMHRNELPPKRRIWSWWWT